MTPTLNSYKEFFKKASGKTKFKLGFLGLTGLTVIFCSGWLVLSIWKASRGPGHTPTPARSQSSELAAREPLSITYDLKGISISLSDRTGRRSGFAQFNLTLDLPGGESKRWCELNRAQMVHLIIEQGAKFSLEDFENPRGYELFKKNLEESFRERFKEHAPRAILFREFSMH